MGNKSALVGILFMLANTLACTIQDMSAKILKESISAAYITFLYKLILFIAILPWVFRGGKTVLKSDKWHYHLLRSLLSVLGAICFYHGLHYVPMADASALENVQFILSVMIGMIFFGEKCTNTKIASVLIGFIGAVTVVNPGLLTGEGCSNFSSKYIYTALAIVFWTLGGVVIKILGRTEKNKAQVFYLMLFGTLWAALFSLVKWDGADVMGMSLNVVPAGFSDLTSIGLELVHFKYLALMATCYYIHSVAIFKAFQFDLSVVEPFRYSKLVFAGVVGFLVFGHVPGVNAWVGYTLIIFSGCMMGRYEYRKHRSRKRAKKLEESMSNDN